MSMTTLETTRDALRTIPGVVSCKVGIEKGLGPADYPMVRVVPSRIRPGQPYGHRTIEATIYFGMDRGESETGGLEAVYAGLFDLENAIIERVRSLGGRYLATITDEDRLDTYKLMALQVELRA